MKKQIKLKILFTAFICLLILICAAACRKAAKDSDEEPLPSAAQEEVAPSVDETPKPAPPRPAPPPPWPGPDVVLKPYEGVVEHIYFQEAIAWPELAFDGNPRQNTYDETAVTVAEFNKILESLHSRKFILVNLNDVWSEFYDEDNIRRLRRNTLMLPEGKKPIVISFDDINFYEYMRGDGFMEKLVIGEDGDIWATGVDPNGDEIISQDFSVVTILDKFVREHPDFSLHGAKGCIALTGYEGILGYRTNNDLDDDSEEFRLNRMREIAQVRPVVSRLKETGWYFATHSYGHINLETSDLEKVKADANRWLDEVGSLVGETKIFIYPYGIRLDGGDVWNTGPALRFYYGLGFRIFASIGFEPYSRIKPEIAAVVVDRMNVDGRTLRNSSHFERFYNSADILDPARPESP